MRASVGAFAIFMATISCCTSTALAKSTASTAAAAVDTNTKTRLRRRAQRNVIDVQISEKNNVATKEDEMALFELETAQFANRFLQQSGSNGRKRDRDESEESEESEDESVEDESEESEDESVEEESEESEDEFVEEESEESEDESVEEESTPVDDFAPPAAAARAEDDDKKEKPANTKDPAVIIAEHLIPEKKDKKDNKTDKEQDTPDIKVEQAPKGEPSNCSDLTEDKRADAIRKQLSEITDLAILDNDMTAQGKAYDWITYFDNARLCPGGSDKHLLNQRYILATLYFSTSGDDWFSCFMSDPNCASTSISVSDFNPSIGGAMGASSWLSGASAGSECSWHGIRCNDDKHVQKVEIGTSIRARAIKSCLKHTHVFFYFLFTYGNLTALLIQ